MRVFSRLRDLESGDKPNGNSSKDSSPNPQSSSTTRNDLGHSAANIPSLFTPEIETLLGEFLEKYDPKPLNLPAIYPMTDQRAMIRTMFLDNILYTTASLHKHHWIALSENSLYKEMCTVDRWDQITDDLNRYTKALRDYEWWLKCHVQQLELEPCALPPTFQTYGRTLAMLECAKQRSFSTASNESAAIAALSTSLMRSHIAWSQPNAHLRTINEHQKLAHARNKNLLCRVWMAIFSGCTLIVPMLIMVLDQRRITTLLTTSVFTLAIGLILAWWMDDADTKDIATATAAYLCCGIGRLCRQKYLNAGV